MKLKFIPVLILILFAAQLCYGEITTELETHENRVFFGEEATFTLSVKNEGDETEMIEYSFPSKSGWSIITNPIITKRSVQPGETLYTEIRIMPVDSRMLPKRYDIPYTIESSEERFEGRLQVYLRSITAQREYVPVVNVNINMPEEIVPTEPLDIHFILSNQNYLNISDYILNVKSEKFPENNQEIKIPIGPNGQEERTITFDYPHSTPPKTDIITIEKSIPSKNRTYKTVTKELKIKGYTEVDTQRDTEKSFLKSSETITLSNSGNIVAHENITSPSSLLGSIFTSTNPDYTIERIDGYRYLQWSLSLEPGETKQIHSTTNYRPFFIIILLLIIGMVIYYYERSPVVIKKETKKIPGHEGETSRIKILLHVKNRTAKPQENITVVDTVSKIAQMETNKTVGTMQPSKVMNHGKKGTIVKWNIPVLEAFEERIITYQIYSKLEIIGPMKLEKAMVKFKNKRGKISRSYSNQVHST